MPEYVDRSVGDVMCVRYDEHSKFVGASYSSGALRVLNSVTGKVVQCLFSPSELEAATIINSLRFRHFNSKEGLATVDTAGQVKYYSL